MSLFIHLLFFPIHKIIIVNIFSTYIKKKIYLVLAAPSLCCCTGAAFQPQRLGFSLGRSLCSKQGLCSATVPGLLTGTVSLRSAWAPHWDGFSCCGTRALGCVGFSGCNMQAQQLWRMGLVAPQHGLSPWTRDQTHVPCIGKWIPIHFTAREVLSKLFLIVFLYFKVMDQTYLKKYKFFFITIY